MPYRPLPPARSKDDIRELARDLFSGHVWTVDEVPPRDVSMVFLVLNFGNIFEGYRKSQLSRLFVFATVGKDVTAPLACNGMPIFFSAHIWRRSDAQKAYDLAKRMEAVV